MLACRIVCCRVCILQQSDCHIRVCISHQSDCHIRVYVSCTNHITAFGYLVPVKEFGYCFLANDVMESGDHDKEWHELEILGSFDKCNGCGLTRALSIKVEIYIILN